MRILLTTLHAKYVHASLALPCLAAACSGIDGIEMVIREYTVNEPRDETLRRIVAEQADVAAFSCYIWNIEQTLRLASDLKQVNPRTLIILGGPEASFGTFELMERHRSVDCIVKGEGEETFRQCVRALARRGEEGPRHANLSDIDGLVFRAGEDIVATPERPPLTDLDAIPSPFALGLADLAKPLVYWETSRGCPFTCAFCMSSLEKGVRSFSGERVRSDLGILMASGARTVKLVDRTFNYDPRRAGEIWDFILRDNRESSFHFEIAADLLTEENFSLLERVPSGMFQFEIGVQSGREETLARVGRKSDMERLSANVRRLVATTGVTVHLDLVAGLPHEDYDGFLDSLQQVFDLLSLNTPYFFACRPPFVQVEPLKVLKGSPMRRIAVDEGYRFSDTPPYKILQTPWLSFEEIGRIEAISRHVDLFLNSGRFRATLASLARTAPLARIFDRLARFREHQLSDVPRSLVALFEYLWIFGETVTAGDGRERLREALSYDYCLAECPVAGKEPRFLREISGTTAGDGKKEKPADLARRLGIRQGSRVRTHCRRFAHDPRKSDAEQREVELVFVYVSAPGRGLDVRVLETGHQENRNR
jgi:anaerobic magnesium-protoporphyrin IX monomethyl ester cyclase